MARGGVIESAYSAIIGSIIIDRDYGQPESLM